MHTAESSVPETSSFNVIINTENPKIYISPGTDKFQRNWPKQ
jgi:hypothetical protein